ncbi:hypothetical protein HMPREF0860_1525 [Treponema socranskii subsp. socranskii VPI DR56BR1116 = ATCC 35536]|uniref:Uncharacterized protein n=1 Tax=Treponema socranskii subsp. socranskii VPI DR56BR1116 = ATCC 35536 TaxID=1125725 RepID=U2L082_TRESO|nr:hypothetical protein [Treponema socranskii]ERF60226.1 hypothetical protein HMPREF1325_2497 [Treponema socranskii subsp. socranskii VPI DR56BR1116 = ATCC 35536]ERK04112.1 hypothetical protein HMPREF0860_1525 [Treponema socranskii subsp. socranskii VPI DR56BR1116 = ATCC 35536]
MYLFFIKKNFYDGWDNMLSLIVINLVIMTVSLGLLSLIYALQQSVPLVIALIILFGIVISILTLASGEVASSAANFGSAHIADFFRAIPSCIADGIRFGLILSVVGTAAYVCIPFYFAQKTLPTMFIGSMFVWLVVFTLLSLQWFVAIRSLMHNDFKKCLKKCFIVFFDNIWFSLFTVVYNFFLLALSVFLFGLLPSVAGITLAQVNALRLRLYKYDYYEAHPELKTPKEKRYIPWDELLQNDKETLEPRSFKSLIFPWKE